MVNWMRTAWAAIVVAAVVGALAWGGWSVHALRVERERGRAAALRADSAEAARDSSREVVVSERLRGLVGDSAAVHERRVLQVRQEADSLDRALGRERAARYRVEAEVAALRAVAAAPVSVDAADSVREGRFIVRQAPYHVEASVVLPRPPAPGRMDMVVRVDSATFEARVGCGAEGVGGVRPATLALVGPAWVRARIVRVEQEPRVCSPPAPLRVEGVLTRWLERIRLGVGYGAVLGADGRIVRGPGVAVVWSVWP